MESSGIKKDKENKKSDKPLGLCANCINYEYCSYAKRAVKPVLFCEEYDIYRKLAEKYDLEVGKDSKKKKSRK